MATSWPPGLKQWLQQYKLASACVAAGWVQAGGIEFNNTCHPRDMCT